MKMQAWLSGIMLVLFSCPALAYIDPSSGSVIISTIIGIFVALSLTVKSYWYKLKSFFLGSNSKDEIKPNDDKNVTEPEQ